MLEMEAKHQEEYGTLMKVHGFMEIPGNSWKFIEIHGVSLNFMEFHGMS